MPQILSNFKLDDPAQSIALKSLIECPNRQQNANDHNDNASKQKQTKSNGS